MISEESIKCYSLTREKDKVVRVDGRALSKKCISSRNFGISLEIYNINLRES